uniref:Regulator of telomere elongation helicase 1 homolog n=1 Tax=Anopheles culicifacies TaxID=139723 RepID=A0A182MAW6_9DIPT
MPEYIINGVPVNFPFEPYQLQKNYMAKVIECLQNKSNGVLESPTGTGKTLSLLCSSLAWLLFMKSKVPQSCSDTLDTLHLPELSDLSPEEALDRQEQEKDAKVKIIYASRTHAQLSQAMQELKNTGYHCVRAIVLGSRDQLCIHGEISKQDNNAIKTTLCREAVKSRRCSFYNRVEWVKDRPAVTSVPVLDIEDLVKVGRKMKACPYYLSKELIEQADIIFMPYNYLLDPKARKSNGLNLQNSVIIVDEAHNVEKLCEEIGSAKLRSSDIATAIEDTSTVIQVMMNAGEAVCSLDVDKQPDFTVDDLVLLKEILLNVEKAVDGVSMMFSQGGITHPGTYIFDLMEKANIKFGNVKAILKLLNSLITHITTTMLNDFVRLGAGLQLVADFLEVVYAGNGPEYRQAIEKCFRVHIEFDESKQTTKGNVTRANGWTASKQDIKALAKPNSKVVNFWCFNPGFGMKRLLDSGPRSIILTSGTLAPLKPLISELNMPVAVTLENPHIIGRNQVYVKVITHGPDRVELNSSFKNRSNPKYLSSLGRTALSLCPIIPGGLLIFFPSYPLLHKCCEEWQASGIWEQINRIKTIFIEPRDKDSFLTTMAEYYAKVRDPESRGAIFMAVCRGKVSEGLDFVDANGRAVMITGLPFPPMMDARVMLKKEYLDTNRTRENELITGNDWYSLEASRAVNQAIGRVIRHKYDFGAILLCDSRFQSARQQSQLSTWIHSHLRDERNAPKFGTVVGEMSSFFRNMAKFSAPARVREVYTIELEDDEDENCCAEPASNTAADLPYDEKFRMNDYLYESKQKHPLMDKNAQALNSSDPEASSSELVTLYKRELKNDHGLLRSPKTCSDLNLVEHKHVLVPKKFIKIEPFESTIAHISVVEDSDVEIIEPGAEQQKPRIAHNPLMQALDVEIIEPKVEPQETRIAHKPLKQASDVEIIEPMVEQREPRTSQENRVLVARKKRNQAYVPEKFIKIEPFESTSAAISVVEDLDIEIIEPTAKQQEQHSAHKPLKQDSDVVIIEPIAEQQESRTAHENRVLVARKKALVSEKLIKIEPFESTSAHMPVVEDLKVEIIEPVVEQNETRTAHKSLEEDSDVEIIDPIAEQQEQRTAPESRVDFLHAIKSSLDVDKYKQFLRALSVYHRDSNFTVFIERMVFCLEAPHSLYLLRAMRRFVKPEHKLQFDIRMEQITL